MRFCKTPAFSVEVPMYSGGMLIHAKRWTREQAIAYMREKTGMGEKEVTAEIERYIVSPAQACAYTVGMLKIQGLPRVPSRNWGRNSISANSTTPCSRMAPCRSRFSKNK